MALGLSDPKHPLATGWHCRDVCWYPAPAPEQRDAAAWIIRTAWEPREARRKTGLSFPSESSSAAEKLA